MAIRDDRFGSQLAFGADWQLVPDEAHWISAGGANHFRRLAEALPLAGILAHDQTNSIGIAGHRQRIADGEHRCRARDAELCGFAQSAAHERTTRDGIPLVHDGDREVGVIEDDQHRWLAVDLGKWKVSPRRDPS